MHRHIILKKTSSDLHEHSNEIRIDIPLYLQAYKQYKIDLLKVRIDNYTDSLFEDISGKWVKLPKIPNYYDKPIWDTFQNKIYIDPLPLNQIALVSSNNDTNSVLEGAISHLKDPIHFNLLATSPIRDGEFILENSEWNKRPTNGNIILTLFNQDYFKICVEDYFINIRLYYDEDPNN